MAYTTGQPDIKLHITSEKNVTVDDVVNEVNTMWLNVKSRNDREDIILAELRNSNPQICKSYPIVVRYMVQMRQFNKIALKKYLLKIKKHPWTSEEEYMESQADYVVLLYKSLGKVKTNIEATALKNNIVATLKNESVVFKQQLESADKLITDKERNLALDANRDLVNFIGIAAHTIESRANTVRVETDLVSGPAPILMVDPAHDGSNYGASYDLLYN